MSDYFGPAIDKHSRDWTLHSSLTGSLGYPSFRLITALRLYHLVPAGADIQVSEETLQRWRETLLGRTEFISESNESEWHETLLNICRTLKERTEKWMKDYGRSSDSRLENIKILWDEERFVATAVIDSIERHEI